MFLYVLFEIQVFVSNKIAKRGSLHFAPTFIHEKRMRKTLFFWSLFLCPNQSIMHYNWIIVFGSAWVTCYQSWYYNYVCRMKNMVRGLRIYILVHVIWSDLWSCLLIMVPCFDSLCIIQWRLQKFFQDAPQ